MDIRGFRAALRALEREIIISLEGQSACCQVSLPQCHVIMELRGAGCINLTGLAARLELDKSTLSRTVDGLVRLGYVQRSQDPGNRRQQIICLSDAGIAKAEAINRLCDRQYAQQFGHLDSRQQDIMVQGIGLLTDSIRQQCKAEAFAGVCHDCD